jgi:hypothetical protein
MFAIEIGDVFGAKTKKAKQKRSNVQIGTVGILFGPHYDNHP